MREREAAHSGSQTEEAVRRIAELRAQGCRLYYFVPDFTSDEGLWRGVFRSYLRAYSAADQAALILMLPEADASAELGEMLELLAALGEDAPLVLAHTYSDDFFVAAVRGGDCFIAAQEALSAHCADIAARAGAEISSGQDWMPYQWEYDVSVCVATYHSDDEMLFATLTSIVQQRGCSFEILVGDDGSEHFDVKRVELWLLQHRFKDYTILHSAENRGTVLNYMNMYVHACGHYIKNLSPGDFFYSNHALADMMQFMKQNGYQFAFGRSCNYRKEKNQYIIVDRMNPHHLRPYREGAVSAIKEAYLVCQDYAVGAAFLVDRELMISYTRDIVGHVTYMEDGVHIMMVADDIPLGFWDHNFIWYECETGISGGPSQEWIERLGRDHCTVLMMIAQRHPELRELCTWHVGGRKPSDVPYMKIMEEYYAEMRRVRETTSYLQSVDPNELKKLVHGEVLFALNENAAEGNSARHSGAQAFERPAVLAEETQRKLNNFFVKVSQLREVVGQQLRSEAYENVMRSMEYLATILYHCNQTYTDEVLEEYLSTLSKLLPEPSSVQETHERQRIVFYDAFGYDIRGLAFIYLRALSRMDVDLYYIAPESAQGNIPRLEAILNECGGCICFLPDAAKTGAWSRTHLLCSLMDEIRPDIGFLYTTPWDIAGILTFMRFAGRMKRYQINLTDHAFWLGVNAFDYCLEFRDFGANVSRQYRKIAPQKILKQLYYPCVDRTLPFQGFPFEKATGDFIIFSGGAVYKTLDRTKIYYQIVDFCLANFPQVKFWYAGTGPQNQFLDLRALEQKYVGRVFLTGEYEDLFQIMQNVDMYLNTCPQVGGLMTQYAALAGRPPFNFLCLPYGTGASSVLLPVEDLGIEYTDMEEFLAELRNFIEDPTYRQMKENEFCTKKLVITETEFAENLAKILSENRSDYPIQVFDVDLRVQKVLYAQLWEQARWDEVDFE